MELQFSASHAHGTEQEDTCEHPTGEQAFQGSRSSTGAGALRLSPILSALLSLLEIIKENGCFPEPGPEPSALSALPKSSCNKFIGIMLPSLNPSPSPHMGDLKGLKPRQ